MRITTLCVAIAIALLTGTSPSRASCNIFEDITQCFVGKPADDQGMPQDDPNLITITHKSPLALNDSDMYAVTITCRIANISNKPDWAPFVATNLVTSHIVALTTTKLASAQLPTGNNAQALITAFSVAGDAKNRQIFLNENCKSQFLISGRDNLYLAATANQATTNAPGPATQAIFQLIQVAIPILPLIKGTALAAQVLGDVSKTEDPLNKIFAELDKGRTVTKSDDLHIGDNLITTRYSVVTVNVSKVKSLLDPGNGDFLKIFTRATDDAEKTLGVVAGDAGTQKCSDYATGLRGRNFSPPDIAYSLILVSQAAHLNKDDTIECLGEHFAATALDQAESSAWSRYFGQNFTLAEAKSHFASEAGSLPLFPNQPKFAKWVHKLTAFNLAVGAYLQAKSVPSGAEDPSKYFAQAIHVLPQTDMFMASGNEVDLKPHELLDDLIAKQFTRIGCLTSDTQALAAYILFRQTSPNQTLFKPSDSAVLRVWYDENQNVSIVEIDYDPGVLEKALSGKSERFCGDNTLEVAAAPKAADTTAPAKPGVTPDAKPAPALGQTNN